MRLGVSRHSAAHAVFRESVKGLVFHPSVLGCGIRRRVTIGIKNPVPLNRLLA